MITIKLNGKNTEFAASITVSALLDCLNISAQQVAVPVVWSGRRSDDNCPGQLAWALPGFYHVFAAAYGSTPSDVQFEVTRATPRIVTRTPRPRPSATTSPTARPTVTSGAEPGARSTVKPTAKPSAKVSGKGSACGGDNVAESC